MTSIQQMHEYFLLIILFPILILQALIILIRTPVLREPLGEREGHSGSGQELSIVVLGDSSGAGVGVSQQSEALIGCLISELSLRFSLSWRLLASSGLKSFQLIRYCPEIFRDADIVVLACGVNDVISLSSPSAFGVNLLILFEHIAKRGTKHVLICPIPCLRRFPALMFPLSYILDIRAHRLNMEMDFQVKKWNNNRENLLKIIKVSELKLENATKIKDGEMATDGFHPGPVTYAHWAKELINTMKTHNILSSDAYPSKLPSEERSNHCDTLHT